MSSADRVTSRTSTQAEPDRGSRLGRILTGEWVIERSTARQRRIIHYWLTIIWVTLGLAIWIILRDALWFVGFMSLYAIWITHLAGWAAETPVEREDVEGVETEA
jgi:hypothetical protein